jgi:hypothetical protein
MAVIDRIGPYVDQLLENQDVQANLQRAAARARQAYGGVKGKKTKKKALSDNRVRRQLQQSVAAARDAAVAVKRGREEKESKERRRRRRRGRLLLGVAVVAAGALLALNEDVRNRMLGLLSGSADSSGEPAEAAEHGEAHGSSSATPAPVDPGRSV